MASDTDALQCCYYLEDIVERDVGGEIGSADVGCYDKSDFSAFEFFIELNRADDFAPRKILRQTRWQIESLQKVDHRIALSGRESGSFD